MHFLNCSVCLDAIASNFLYASSGEVCWVISASRKSYRCGLRYLLFVIFVKVTKAHFIKIGSITYLYVR